MALRWRRFEGNNQFVQLEKPTQAYERFTPPPPMNRNRQRVILGIGSLLLIFFLYFQYSSNQKKELQSATTGALLRLPDTLPPANSTLGFGAIVAIPQATPGQGHAVIQLAESTGLTITTHDQISSQSSVNHGRLANTTLPDVMEWFLSTTLSTVLVLSGEVNWSIDLRTLQIPKAAAAFRHLMIHPATNHRFPKDQQFVNTTDENNYWGDASSTGSWEILYLGHCGDVFDSSEWNFKVPRAAFFDPTLPKRHEMHRETRDFLNALHVTKSVRLVHKSINPSCISAIAVTRRAAAKLLQRRLHDEGSLENEVGKAPEIQVGSVGLKSWTVNPELFHAHDEGG